MVNCTKRTYDASLAYCESEGAFTASIHSQEEEDIVYGMIKAQCGNGSHAYIGAYTPTKNAWRWDDGTPWDYVNPFNDGLNGNSQWSSNVEERMVIHSDGRWGDWADGEA